jgi:hypothetical protein
VGSNKQTTDIGSLADNTEGIVRKAQKRATHSK